jgi:hypothetical protein
VNGRILGIDLSAQPQGTGAVWLEVQEGQALVTPIDGPMTDDRLLGLMPDAARIAIDVPLGWPHPFIEAVSQHHAFRGWPTSEEGPDRTRSARLRRTDIAVQERLGGQVLSVSADKIGIVAMRGARLQALWSERTGQQVDRTGSSTWIEVYPAGALRIWGLKHQKYKGPKLAASRAVLVDALLAESGWLQIDHVDLLRRSDDVLDAAIAAVVGLAAALGLTDPPSGAQLGAALREGWIHLPTVELPEIGRRLQDAIGAENTFESVGEKLVAVAVAWDLPGSAQRDMERVFLALGGAIFKAGILEDAAKVAAVAPAIPADDATLARATIAEGRGESLHDAIDVLSGLHLGGNSTTSGAALHAARQMRNQLAHGYAFQVLPRLTNGGVDDVVGELERASAEFERLTRELVITAFVGPLSERGVDSEELLAMAETLGRAVGEFPDFFAGLDLRDGEAVFEALQGIVDQLGVDVESEGI